MSDTSAEAVETLAQGIVGCQPFAPWLYEAGDTLRALAAERYALREANSAAALDYQASISAAYAEADELRAQLAAAEAQAKTARDDALREAADACCHPTNVEAGGESAICRGRVLALINTPTKDPKP